MGTGENSSIGQNTSIAHESNLEFSRSNPSHSMYRTMDNKRVYMEDIRNRNYYCPINTFI